jgi:subtilisin
MHGVWRRIGALRRAALNTGRHLVLLRDGLGRSGARALEKAAGLRVGLSSDHEGRAESGHHVSPGEGLLFHRLGAALVHADPDQLAALGGLGSRTDNEFVSVEPERIVRAIQLPGDRVSAAAVGAAAGSGPVTAQDSWGLQATRVQMSRFSGRGVRIAVLDTGLDLKHPDFATRAVVSESFVPDAAVQDASGHGTYCVGVACGPAVPSQPPRYGVACDAELYVGKVIADDGSGTDGSILAGMDWAVRSGCAIVSLSIGSPVAPGEPFSAIYEQVAQRALAGGTLIMAAAGNDSVRPDSVAPVDHPANCPSIFAIAAVDVYLRVAPFSCGGVNVDGGEVDIAAPGVAIRSSWPLPHLYRTDSGTSMATPLAAGIAALVAEANPSKRGRELLMMLTQSALPLTLPARDVGAGLIQAP